MRPVLSVTQQIDLQVINDLFHPKMAFQQHSVASTVVLDANSDVQLANELDKAEILTTRTQGADPNRNKVGTDQRRTATRNEKPGTRG